MLVTNINNKALRPYYNFLIKIIQYNGEAASITNEAGHKEQTKDNGVPADNLKGRAGTTSW
jgi:hypothetical protein